MEPRVISTAQQHEAALAELDRLILDDPKKGTPEAQRLEVLSVLIEAYERDRFVIEKPTPVEAIRFRMGEMGLSQRDLVPYFGSKGKVSEVLSGKATLSLRVIRRLNEALGIPADVLIQDSAPAANDDEELLDWSKVPVKEMVKAGWIRAAPHEIRNDASRLAATFFDSIGSTMPSAVLCKRAVHRRTSTDSDRYALLAWTAQLLKLARSHDLPGFKTGSVNEEFVRAVVHLSPHFDGPLRAQELLSKHGIPLVVLSQLPGMKLDGVATLSGDGRPVIGMTLRYDRLDNFWFTLLHELAHVSLHLSEETPTFVDDLDMPSERDPREREADEMAREVSVPRSILRRDFAYQRKDVESVMLLARKLGVHPSIVAGRVRRESNNYRILNQLVGHRQVRNLFEAM